MPLAPMLMFAILFGLSMDYEVFLLSRVREQYLKHLDPRRAVVEGVGSTARVITSAALIMISVFASLHPRPRGDDQDVRRRPVGRRLPGRHAGPDDPGPGGDEPARTPGLVAAGLAASVGCRRSTSRVATTTARCSSLLRPSRSVSSSSSDRTPAASCGRSLSGPAAASLGWPACAARCSWRARATARRCWRWPADAG